MTDIPISAYIICKNERRFLGKCLDSLEGVREIVVVDSGSTDGTLDLIRDYQQRGFPIRLFEREWQGYARQKQFALEQCRLDWRLNLDADERLDPELRIALAAPRPEDPGVAAYKLYRIDWLPGYGWPSKFVHKRTVPRLMHADRVRYDVATAVHEGVIFDGRIEHIREGCILHDRLLSISEEIPKITNYSRLKARALKEKGRKASLFSLFFNPIGRFVKSYLLQRYFLCGKAGLIYATILAIYVFMTEAMLYRLHDVPELPEV